MLHLIFMLLMIDFPRLQDTPQVRKEPNPIELWVDQNFEHFREEIRADEFTTERARSLEAAIIRELENRNVECIQIEFWRLNFWHGESMWISHNFDLVFLTKKYPIITKERLIAKLTEAADVLERSYSKNSVDGRIYELDVSQTWNVRSPYTLNISCGIKYQ